MEWKVGNKIYCERAMIFKPTDLDDDQVLNEIKANSYHLYILCKRKRMRFMSCDTSDENHNVSKFYTLDDNDDKVTLSRHHSKNLVISASDRRYLDVAFQGVTEHVRDFIVLNLFYHLDEDKVGNSVPEAIETDLEVLYIGQALGRKTLRKIDYRVRRHENIQKSAFDIIDKNHNDELFVIGLCPEVGDLATAFSPRSNNKRQTRDDLVQSLLKAKERAKRRLANDQEITLYEAALINYFQPPYNKEYKQSFPEVGITSYEEIFETEFDYVHMSIDTWQIKVRLFSEHVHERKYIHSRHYQLKTVDEKKAFLEYLIEP